jgi:hypothetical protein
MVKHITEKGEEIYSRNKEELERKLFGKVAAINVGKREISGKGDSIVEAAKETMGNIPERSSISRESAFHGQILVYQTSLLGLLVNCFYRSHGFRCLSGLSD